MKIKFNAMQKLRPRETKVNIDNWGLSLPPIFKLFITYYSLGDESELFDSFKIKRSGEESVRTIQWSNLTKENMFKIENDRLRKLLNFDDLKIELDKFKNQIDLWHKEGKVLIGYTLSDIILLGFNDAAKDKIFLYGEGTDGKIELIANDIFDFFLKIEMFPDTDILNVYNINLDFCFKNIGEDFWRVKSDSKVS